MRKSTYVRTYRLQAGKSKEPFSTGTVPSVSEEDGIRGQKEDDTMRKSTYVRTYVIPPASGENQRVLFHTHCTKCLITVCNRVVQRNGLRVGDAVDVVDVDGGLCLWFRVVVLLLYVY